MRTYTTTHTVYTFDELSEEQQQKAIENLYDINVDHEWWDFTYEDAATIGLKITGFDLGRAQSVEGEFTVDSEEAAQAIMRDHGASCETYQTAQEYLFTLKVLVKEQCQQEADFLCTPLQDEIYLETIKQENDWLLDDTTEAAEAEFLHSLLEDYRIILSKEYDYLTSEDAIRETIKANEYEFTEEGVIA